jgi:diadenylate cyclase
MLNAVVNFIRAYWHNALEIAIIGVLLYFVLRYMRGTRGEGILKGLAMILIGAFAVISYVAKWFDLRNLDVLVSEILKTSILALIIIFQPELRRGLLQIGESPLVKLFMKSEINVLEEIIESVIRLSKKKVGALIAIEREVGLGTYIEGGTKLYADVRSELIDTIFFPGSTLHDGAIIIQNERIAAAGCLFPLTDNPVVSKGLGTRHRAGIGLTEETDAITIIVSEETGAVSVGHKGKLVRNLDKKSLEELLRKLYLQREEEKQKIPEQEGSGKR